MLVVSLLRLLTRGSPPSQCCLLLICGLVLVLTQRVVSAAPSPRESGNLFVEEYGFGNLNSLRVDFPKTTSGVIVNIKEDRYNPGSLFLMSLFVIHKFVPGQPIELFLGNKSQATNNYVAGNSSVAEFTLINDLVQYNKTKYAMSDYFNNCVREYNSETDMVRPLIGQCGPHDQSSYKSLSIGEFVSGETNFLWGVRALELVEADNYLIVCDQGYSQLSKFDLTTGIASLLLGNRHSNLDLPNPTSLLLNTEQTTLYVSHSYGLSGVDLQTLEVTLLVGEVVPSLDSSRKSMMAGVFDEASVGVMDSMTWLIANKVILSTDELNEALILIDLEKRKVLTGCIGDLRDTSAVVESQSICRLNSPTAVSVSNDTIYITAIPHHHPQNYSSPTLMGSLYTVEVGLFHDSNMKSSHESWNATVHMTSNKDELCPQCAIKVYIGDLQRVQRESDAILKHTIYVLKEDRYSPGTFYYNSMYTLVKFTPDLPARIFLGNATQSEERYTAGNSTTAEFSTIFDIIQYNRTKMLLADFANNCVREYDMETDEVRQFVGSCTGVFEVMFVLEPGEIRTANSHFLSGVISITLIESRDILVICDFGYRLISKYDFKTGKVQLLGENFEDLLPNPHNCVTDKEEKSLFVSHSYGISRVNLDSMLVTLLTGQSVGNEGTDDIPFIPGTFQQARTGLTEAIQWLIQDELLVTVGGGLNGLLIFVDLRGEQVYSACAGSNLSYVTILGPLGTCELNVPTAVAVASDGTIYIASLIDGINPGNYEPYKKSALYKLKTQAASCEFITPTGHEVATPSRRTYGQYEEIVVSCPSGRGLNSTLNRRKCTADLAWDMPLPGCMQITSSDDINVTSSRKGQLSGGTEIVLVGLIPDVGAEILVNDSSGELTKLNFTAQPQKLSFRMPSSSSVGPVEIIVKLTENVTATYQFLYAEDPVVNYTVSASTIVSGGPDVVFNVINADSSNDYTLRADYQDYNTACVQQQQQQDHVSCSTEGFPELLELNRTMSLRIQLFSDGVLVKNSNSTPLLLYPDPLFDASLTLLEPGEALRLTGEHLDVRALNAEYEISIRLASGETIECDVLNVTAAALTCQPDIGGHQPGSDPSNVTITLGDEFINDVKVIFLLTDDLTPSTNWSVSTKSAAAAVIIVAVIIVVTVAALLCKKQHNNSRKLSERCTSSVKLTPPAEAEDWFTNINADLKAKLDPLMIEPDSLKFCKTFAIGEGNYGKIFKGELYQGGLVTTVAIKTLKGLQTPKEVIEKFLEEAVILQDFRHPNVLSTLGVCIPDSETPQVILPYMANGDLKSLIKREDVTFTFGDLMRFARQISYGMEYLVQNKFVHRDLAARNCLVDDHYIVRIADFGLSRDIYSKDYYRREEKGGVPLPIKWLALESLQCGLFSTQSDVWSYGVLVWELATRGAQPYMDVNPWDLRSYLEAGRRLHQPNYCSSDLWNLMSSCWLENPGDRPSFTHIHSYLTKLLEGADCTHQSPCIDVPDLNKIICNDYADMPLDPVVEDYMVPKRTHERR